MLMGKNASITIIANTTADYGGAIERNHKINETCLFSSTLKLLLLFQKHFALRNKKYFMQQQPLRFRFPFLRKHQRFLSPINNVTVFFSHSKRER